MSQNIRAAGASASAHGSSSKVAGSGRARTSDSCLRLKPSIELPSKVMPSARAPSSSAGLMAKLFSVPSTSVNQRRTRRMPRSSTVRNTYSWRRSMAANDGSDPPPLRHSGPGHSQCVHIREKGGKRVFPYRSTRQPFSPLNEGNSANGDQGRVHLDRRHRADGQAAVEDQDPPEEGRDRRPADLGLRRLLHQPGARLRVGLRAEARLLLSRPDPRRRQHPGHDRGAAHRHDAAPDQHPGPDGGPRREVREAGAAVRSRAGVHPVPRQPPARLPRERLPRPAGSVLLRRRRRRDLRSADGRGAHERLPRGRPRALRHQRRGHARPVGVPDRPGEHDGRRRPHVDGPLAALPHR